MIEQTRYTPSRELAAMNPSNAQLTYQSSRSRYSGITLVLSIIVPFVAGVATTADAAAAQFRAGAAKVDITNVDAGPVNDLLFVKALVLTDGDTTIALVTVDAVASLAQARAAVSRALVT